MPSSTHAARRRADGTIGAGPLSTASRVNSLVVPCSLPVRQRPAEAEPLGNRRAPVGLRVGSDTRLIERAPSPREVDLGLDGGDRQRLVDKLPELVRSLTAAGRVASRSREMDPQ